MTLRDLSGKLRCPVEECDRSYKKASDLHVHIREKPGNDHQILKRIIDRTYCIPCNSHFRRPRDFQHHEKVNHGEAYDSRIELFLEYLTQHAPQNRWMDLTQIKAASDAPAQDLDALASQVFQPISSSTGPQPFTNSHGSQITSTFPFEMPQLPDSLINFPFEYPDFASHTVPLQQNNVGFAKEDNLVVDFSSHYQDSFPIDISPSDDRTPAL